MTVWRWCETSTGFASIHLRSTSGGPHLRKMGVQQNKDIPE